MQEAVNKGSKPVVLVVEDDVLQRIYAVSVIEDAGFAVIEADNADDAIDILESRDDIRIVFTDIEMPGSMDGLRLAHAIRDRWPPIELIVTSGKHQLEVDRLPIRGQFLPKPYQPTALVSSVRALAGD